MTADLQSTLGGADSSLSEEITYSRIGGDSVRLLVVHTKPKFENQVGIDKPQNYPTDDFRFMASDLVLDGEVVEPDVDKDSITDSNGREYRLAPALDESHFDYSDTARTLLKVHTKIQPAS